MQLQRNGASPSRTGPAETFTGSVRIDSPFQAPSPGRVGGAVVSFEPGARSPSDFLMDGGVTSSYWYGDLAPQ